MAELFSANRRIKVRLKVNGRPQEVEVETARMLAQVLRDDLGLTGTKVACGMANCGACTVLRTGLPIYSCITLALDCDGSEITTIEGLADKWAEHMEGASPHAQPLVAPDLGQGELHPLQRTFVDEDAFQCGFCTSGQIMTLAAFLEDHPEPSEDDLRGAVAGNLCRCGAYLKIITAAMKAAEMIRQGTGNGS